MRPLPALFANEPFSFFKLREFLVISCFPIDTFERFDQGRHEDALNQLLGEVYADRVILDSRPLFCDAPSDESERKSQARKPRVPVHPKPIGRHPVVRLIGRNDTNRVTPWIREWAPIIAGWMISGLKPYVFTHTPDELYAPTLARAFHEELRRHTHRADAMSPWPGEAASARDQLQGR